MLVVYLQKDSFQPHIINADNSQLMKEALWIDLLCPTATEEKLVEDILLFDIPTRDEMVEIELSSRLYRENSTLSMTALMIAQSNTPNPQLDPVTFMLLPQQLLTIRYIEPQAFKLATNRLQKSPPIHPNASNVFIELLDAAIDRLADTLELVGHRVDDYSQHLFKSSADETYKLDYRHLLQQIGADGDLNTKARESLIGFNRLTAFYQQSIAEKMSEENQLHLNTIIKDINSLSDHANFLSSKIGFLLDATLGMVNIEQNNIIKIFSIAAVIFLPPTLVASIYGMNFRFMPELSWKYGYMIAIGLICFAAWLPYKYFKYRKWL